jgi:cycloeucalenol cycloisomerase
MVYTIGSCFYGIYFIVSFPTFYRLDENSTNQVKTIPHTMYQTVMEALGCSMAVLLLLDFSRLALGIPLTIGGVGYYLFDKKFKCNA